MNPLSSSLGLAAGSAISAYICWGFFGVYFKALDAAPPVEILGHRILWSLLLLALLISIMGKWQEVKAILYQPRKLALFALSALLISINWGFYIYSVVSGQALEGSMGYFIMPLVAVMLGTLFFGERFSITQGLAIALAVCGVLYQIIVYGKPPLIALTLAFSFGFYGMLRKKAPADSMVGLFLETLLIAPLALAYFASLYHQGELHFANAELPMQALLMLAGPVTAIPLILFAFGARRLRYSTIGLLQYINPTCQFLVAIYIFKEPFDSHNLITFAFIWVGLTLYSLSGLQQSRRSKTSVA